MKALMFELVLDGERRIGAVLLSGLKPKQKKSILQLCQEELQVYDERVTMLHRFRIYDQFS